MNKEFEGKYAVVTGGAVGISFESANILAQKGLSGVVLADLNIEQATESAKKLEEETGIILSNSPTQTVGYEVKSQLEKVKHSHPMLSLGKTKSINDLIKFSNGKNCIISL